uniref:Quaking_NLS domain-containing protein n=1 Tax=Echinococcus granulosus TaxID=6210 RepID=A0A068WCM8_ECHGR|nr:hypothetical protein EgrG_000859500 [Echinococcus granulosus]
MWLSTKSRYDVGRGPRRRHHP